LPNLAFRCYKSVDKLQGMRDVLHKHEFQSKNKADSWTLRDIKSSQLLVFVLLEKAKQFTKQVSHYLQTYNQQELQHFLSELEQLEQKILMSERLLAFYK